MTISQRTSPIKQRRALIPPILVAILLLQALIGVGFTFAIPLWQEHEADFFNVARFLAARGRLPVPEDYTDGDADIRQATQPFLYFVMTAPIVALFDDGQPTPLGVHPLLICPGGSNAAFVRTLTTPAYTFPPTGAPLAGYALRIFGVITALCAVAFTYAAGRRLLPAYPLAAAVGAALVAFEPTLARQSAIISNDTLLLAVAAANLYAVARLLTGKLNARTLIPVIITAGLAALTRLPGWAVLAFDAVIIAWIVLQRVVDLRDGRRRRALWIGGAGVLALIGLAFAIGAFNLARYGSLIGRYENLDQIVLTALRDFRLPVVTLVGIFDQTWHDSQNLIEALRPRAILARAYGWLPGLILALAAAGALLAFIRPSRARDQATDARGGVTILGLALISAVALVIVRNITVASDANTTLYHTNYIFAPLRYYMPGLPALGLLAGVGAALLAVRFARWSAPITRWVGSAAVLGLILPFALVGALSAARIAAETPPDPVVPRESVQGIAPPTPESPPNSGAPTILGYQTRADGTTLDLTLYVTVDASTSVNWIARVTLGGGSCELAPSAGVYPSTRWQPGDVIRIPMRVPYCPLDAAAASVLEAGAPILVTWLPFDTNAHLMEAIAPPIPLGVTDAPMPRAPACPQPLATFAAAYHVIKYNAPPPIRRGETLVPSLNWLVTTPDPAALARVFVFRHDATGAEIACSSMTRYMNAWGRGEIVYFDGCPLTFPPDAPTGSYTVYVGVQDAALTYLPGTDADGRAAPLIAVGTQHVDP